MLPAEIDDAAVALGMVLEFVRAAQRIAMKGLRLPFFAQCDTQIARDRGGNGLAPHCRPAILMTEQKLQV